MLRKRGGEKRPFVFFCVRFKKKKKHLIPQWDNQVSASRGRQGGKGGNWPDFKYQGGAPTGCKTSYTTDLAEKKRKGRGKSGSRLPFGTFAREGREALPILR